MNHRQSEEQFSVGAYHKRDLVIVRGEGALVWDEAGREYVDCVAGIGVAYVGHCHPAVVAAVQAQAARLITCNELFYNDARAQCLERLDRLTPEGEWGDPLRCDPVQGPVSRAPGPGRACSPTRSPTPPRPATSAS